MTFSRNAAFMRFFSSFAVVAVAGAGLTATPALSAKDKKEQAAGKADYSKAFVAAYKPVQDEANAAAPDYAALKAQIPAFTAAATTPDDRKAAGQMVFTIGQKTNDFATSLQGVEMVLASGRLDAATQAQFSFVGGQLAYNLKDYAKARTLVQAAIDGGYAENDPQLFLADAYFADKKYAEGLKYLSDAAAARKAAGQTISEDWIKRALATAYTAKLNPEAQKWGLVFARDYPSQTSWGDAIAIAINTGDYARPEMLDLLRLARLTNTIRTKAMYLEYVDAADARKLPNEVVQVLDAGTAANLVDNDIQLVKDARTVAAARIAADKSDLPALLRDASAGSAKLVTVMAAADTLLSYGKYAEAETFYAKAATMPGANVPLVLTREGIAEVGQSKFADAQATFAKVQGERQAIANLWALYAEQKQNGTTIAPAPAAAATQAANPAAEPNGTAN